VLARNGGIPGILLGAAVVAVPAVFVATYGLLVFRDIGGVSEPAGQPPSPGTRPSEPDRAVGRDTSDETNVDGSDGR